MADSFESVWREVHQYAPTVPAPLVQRWTRDAFRSLRGRHLWSWAIAEDQWTFPTAYTSGSITLTNSSKSVSGNGTVWTSAHKGLQLKTNNEIYTVSVVGSSTSITLDRKWAGSTSSSESYSIYKAYVKAPSDFQAFVSVVDPDNEWRLHTHLDRQYLDAIDAARGNSGSPSVVADLFYSSTGRAMYEVWPHVVSTKGIKFLYWKKSSDFSDIQDLPYTVDGDVVKLGALARLCLFPGTRENPNPMFNIRLADRYGREFDEAIGRLITEDNNIYPNDAWYADLGSMPYAPIDAKYLQKHAPML